MLEFKLRACRSWLDPVYGKVLANMVAARLIRRCAGVSCLKIELTYDRSGYDDPREVYRAAREERHVRRFIEDLASLTGEDLTGRWLCKLEFQRGGWVHWHILIRDCKRIEKSLIDEAWGRGFTWVVRAAERELRYMCKYVAKDGVLPAWLYLEPVRSVKVIRVSPGFWGVEYVYAGEVSDGLRPGEGVYRPWMFLKEEDGGERDDVAPLPAYIPIGELVERGRCTTVFRDDSGRYCQVRGDPWRLFERLRRWGAVCVGMNRSWCVLEGVGLSHARSLGTSADEVGRLHSIECGNPPGGLPALPRYAMEFLWWALGWREENSEYTLDMSESECKVCM